MSLALRKVVAGEGPPLLIAHGLLGSARNWGAVQKRLADGFTVTAVDMRNHGGSPRAPTQGYGDMASDLAAAIAGRSHVLGHSMGGKAAMRLALDAPDRVHRLVVADIAPVAYGHSQSHLIEAMRSVDLRRVDSRADADRQLAGSVADPGVRAFLLQSLDVAAREWRLNLDVLAAEMDRITGWEETGGRFDGPALFLAGSESDYVRPEHRDRIRESFPAARLARIEGAGHWLHAERPQAVVDAVRAFLGG